MSRGIPGSFDVRFSRILGSGALGVLLAVGLATAARAAGDPAKGKVIFTTNCTSCHGDDGKGDGPVGVALNPRPRDFTKAEFKFDAAKDGKPGSDAALTNVIKNGAGAYGGSPLMAPWGGTLSDADIQNVIAYIRTFHKS
jgi:mono/diheme cytochrome c family protein